jgi:hypothetical protein
MRGNEHNDLRKKVSYYPGSLSKIYLMECEHLHAQVEIAVYRYLVWNTLTPRTEFAKEKERQQ